MPSKAVSVPSTLICAPRCATRFRMSGAAAAHTLSYRAALIHRCTIEDNDFPLVPADEAAITHLFQHAADHFARSTDHARHFFGAGVYHPQPIHVASEIHQQPRDTAMDVHQSESRAFAVGLAH